MISLQKLLLFGSITVLQLSILPIAGLGSDGPIEKPQPDERPICREYWTECGGSCLTHPMYIPAQKDICGPAFTINCCLQGGLRTYCTCDSDIYRVRCDDILTVCGSTRCPEGFALAGVGSRLACGNHANIYTDHPAPDLFTSICHRTGCSIPCTPEPTWWQSCPNGLQGAPGSDGIMGVCDDGCATDLCGCPDTPNTEAPLNPNDGFHPPVTCVGLFCGGVNPGLGGGFGGTSAFQSMLGTLGSAWKKLRSKLAGANVD